MLDKTNKMSFHGKLIQTVVEQWGRDFLFEQYSEVIKHHLLRVLNNYLPSISCSVSWQDDAEMMDTGKINADIHFVDERGENKVLNLCVVSTGTITQEFNEKN